MSKKKNFIPHYKVFTNTTNFVKVGCTYAGKMYYGVAMCSPEDTFDYEYGYRLAKARCDYRINTAKMKRSQEKIDMYRYYADKFSTMLKDELSYEHKLHVKWLESMAELDEVEYEGHKHER